MIKEDWQLLLLCLAMVVTAVVCVVLGLALVFG
jgi:hypothetical protein